MTEPAAVPPLAAERLLMIASGALGVAFLPFWVNWIRASYPATELRLVLTRSAEHFVTRGALDPLLPTPSIPDRWPDDPASTALHVELAEWPDAVVVHPATFHFTARLALGLADSPALLALQCTSAPIAVAPALPPGGVQSHAHAQHLAALHARPNLVVVPPVPAMSVTTGRPDAWMAAPIPEVVRMLGTLGEPATAVRS